MLQPDDIGRFNKLTVKYDSQYRSQSVAMQQLPALPMAPRKTVPQQGVAKNRTLPPVPNLAVPAKLDPFQLPQASIQLPTKEQLQQKLLAANLKLKELEQKNAESGGDVNSKLKVLDAKIAVQKIKNSAVQQRANVSPDPLRQLVKLREEQLRILDEQLTEESNGKDQASLQNRRKSIRNELGVARTKLIVLSNKMEFGLSHSPCTTTKFMSIGFGLRNRSEKPKR